MKDKGDRIKELEKYIKDRDMACEIYYIFLKWEEENKILMKEKQMEGIKKAREEGTPLGRPRIREPEDFRIIAEAWQVKKIKACEAAIQCGMGVSTFYRRVRDLKIKY